MLGRIATLLRWLSPLLLLLLLLLLVLQLLFLLPLRVLLPLLLTQHPTPQSRPAITLQLRLLRSSPHLPHRSLDDLPVPPLQPRPLPCQARIQP